MVFSGASAEAPRWRDHEGARVRVRALSVSGGAWHYRAVRTPVLDVARPVIRLGARIYFRIRFEGVQHIPRSGPLLIVPNHVTFADPVLATIPVRRPVHYMAWNALFRVPGPRVADPPAARLSGGHRLRRRRAPPGPRCGSSSAGEAVMIFPEAGRSLDGRRPALPPRRVSAGLLARRARAARDHRRRRTSPGLPAARLPRPGRLTHRLSPGRSRRRRTPT